ncbi:Mu transposase C-terminal domain-containing protein [Ureibacillus chungkukjangi]|uniref:Mu transposase C-terminal domain-containing protein n=1 Tax=Ureibacillus chungkukjangi TaxID=1202712 RepID=UPI00203D1B58|nr:Mu transposase C-terminal domain-containing protein [Ureibacillus chungkukjangi]MCM3390603.1 Mu transposase C-terminal domain-containing protein [Ureibacillus chungkukjangi]
MQLAVNQLLQSKHDKNKLERIVWIDDENLTCYLVNIYKPSFPHVVEIEEILHRLETGDLNIKENDPFTYSVDEDELTEVEKQKRNLAWGVIQFLYLVPNIFDPKSRAELIKKASKEFNLSKKSIRQYLLRFWSRGLVKNALLPDYINCGKANGEGKKYKKKAGRPTVYPSSIKRAMVDDEWKRLFRIALEKYYFIRTKPSLKYAYQQMLKTYFSKRDVETRYQILDLDKPIPSFDQFYYWYRKWYKSDYAIRKREGKREFLKNHRSITGSATEDTMGIGVYAVDGTIGDIYLVSSLDKSQIIGRPTIYLLVDISSRCIVGISVSLLNMSGESLRVALVNSFDNKREFCKRVLDMDISEDDWPVHYLPHTILADRGSELISDELTSIAENLHIKIQNTGSFRPELKGVCEAYFGILQEYISPFLPGAVQKDFNNRGVQDYRKQAVLNIKEYTRILIRCIIHYNKRYLRDYPRTKDMIDQNISPTPLEIFKWGLSRGSGSLKCLTSEQIRSNLFPSAEATVNAKGISFSGLYYSSPTALKEQWFSHARTHGSYKVKIQYDPQDMSKIYIRLDRRNYEVCFLIEHYEMYQNSVLEEVLELQKSQRQQESDFEQIELNSQIKLAQEIEEIVKKAKHDARSSGQEKNVKDIKRNRREEKALFQISKLNDTPQVNRLRASEDPSNTKNLDLFRKKQKEALDNDYD